MEMNASVKVQTQLSQYTKKKLKILLFHSWHKTREFWNKSTGKILYSKNGAL